MLTPEKKKKIREALKRYSWEDLEWVESVIEDLKPNAHGFRTYRCTTPRETAEAMSALGEFFANAANQGP